MSENKKNTENISAENSKHQRGVWGPVAVATVAVAALICFVVQLYRDNDKRSLNSNKLKSEQARPRTAHEEITEQMYILEAHKLNDIRNELRRANELQERQLKQDSIRTELARRQYLLDSVQFATKQRKK